MAFLSDIEIAQGAKMQHIRDIAKAAGVDEKYIEQYGNYKAKIDLSLLDDSTKKDGKLILVTAITPTPAGEGKTTTTIGLADGMKKIGKNVTVALREPSLALFSVLRAVPQAAVMLRLFLWRILTFTSQATSMQSVLPIIFWPQCSITISSRVMHSV